MISRLEFIKTSILAMLASFLPNQSKTEDEEVILVFDEVHWEYDFRGLSRFVFHKDGKIDRTIIVGKVEHDLSASFPMKPTNSCALEEYNGKSRGLKFYSMNLESSKVYLHLIYV